jgi:hypothetical protein
MAAAAAAAACATVSGMSLGPWIVPARNIPSAVVSNGLNLGCNSNAKPPGSHETFSNLLRGSQSLGGTTADSRTTKSALTLIN